MYHGDYITGDEAAALLGVSRKTVYRWANEGRIGQPFSRSDIEAKKPRPRPRGPKRNPKSARYEYGRHSFQPRNICTPTSDT